MYHVKHNGKPVESHETLSAATRAFWLLTARELKNGRVANLEFDTHSSDSVAGPEHCRPSLPDWACEALRAHGFEV